MCQEMGSRLTQQSSGSTQVPGSEQAGWTRVREAFSEPPGPYQLGEVDSNAWSLDAIESPSRAVKYKRVVFALLVSLPF